MEKLVIKICSGTTCFVMGGAYLQELIEIIPRRYGEKVEVSGIPCLSMCSSKSNYTKAPYVKVGDDVIEEATVEKVLEAIDNRLGLK